MADDKTVEMKTVSALDDALGIQSQEQPTPEPNETQEKEAAEKEAKDKADKDKADAEAKAKAEADRKPEPTVAELKVEIERLEKRFKDTQGNWTREHQAKLDLEKKAAELEAALKKKDDPEWVDDGDSEQKKLADELKALREERQQEQALRRWNDAEASFKKDNKDYEAVLEVFQPEWEKSQELQARFREEGGSPEAAYRLGRELMEKREASDPVKYREKLKQELLAELKKEAVGKEVKAGKEHQTLGDLNSMKPTQDDNEPHSLLDEVLTRK